MQKQQKQKTTVIFVGAPASGKSCLVNGYTPSYKQTVGAHLSNKTFTIDGKQVQFDLWDISASMIANEKCIDQCKRGQVVGLVYAVNDKQSFEGCQRMAERLLQQDRLRYNAKMILIGTKSDLQREVTQVQGIETSMVLKGNYQSPTQAYFEISSKNDQNVLQKICFGAYKVSKDPTIKTVSDLEQEYKPSETAPSQIVQKPISLQPPKANVIEAEFSRLFKLLLLGSDRCGKTAIVSQYARDLMITEYQPTIGVDFAIKVIEVQGQKIKFQIWDTAGMKKFQSITTAYIKGCKIIFIVFDCSNRQSFLQIPEHMQNVSKYSYDPQNIVKFIVCNKIDLQRVVSREQGEKFAAVNGYQYMQVSALQKINLDELFIMAADQVIKRQPKIS